MDQKSVDTSTTATYSPPAVLDAGEVTEVTLGIMKADKVDDTQYVYS